MQDLGRRLAQASCIHDVSMVCMIAKLRLSMFEQYTSVSPSNHKHS